jgi:hypothetical protein
MQCLYHTGRLHLLAHQHVIWTVHWGIAALQPTSHWKHKCTVLYLQQQSTSNQISSPNGKPLCLLWPLILAPFRKSEKLSSVNFHYLTCSSPNVFGFSRELQEVEEITAMLQYSVEEVYLTLSSWHDLSDFHQPSNSPLSPPEEQVVCSNLDANGKYTHWKENKSPNGLPCSLPIL